MPHPLEAVVSASACRPPSQARGARVAKFRREQRIVDCLNGGLSVARIAAEIGVGEKRMRALIREILARRMPHPPEEFVAIQMSCLNEALLVAFSAMSPTNLKAVDQVVKIVRELDRYGGAFAAEWARPEAPRLDAPADEDVAFAKAWLGGGELEDDRGGDRPEIPLQGLERIESAPGFVQTLEAGADAGAASDGRPAGEAALRGLVAADRPGIPPQRLEKIESAPGIPASPAASTPLAALQPQEGRGEQLGGLSVPPDGIPLIPGSSPAQGRPENPAQSLEKVESAPGIGLRPQTAEAVAAGPVSADLMRSLLTSVAGRQDLRACLSTLRPDRYGAAPRGDGGDFSFVAAAGCARPEIPAQRLENMESAPWLAAKPAEPSARM